MNISASSIKSLTPQSQDVFFTFASEGIANADLVVTGFNVTEAMSELYTIHLSLASRKADLDLEKLMDKGGLLAIHDRYQSEPRYFHGIVAAATRGDKGDTFTFYHLTLLPALHRLRFGSDSRIFQQKNVVDIARIILTENGVEQFEFKLREDHPDREYLTQYNETHLTFVQRILAEEGIAWYFTHSKDGHKLILTDSTPAAEDVAGSDASLEYNATSGGISREHFINSFVWREEVAVSDVSQRDHFFKLPEHSYAADHAASHLNGLQSPLSMYHFPGRYKTDAAGAAFSRYKLEAYRRGASAGQGEGRCPYLTAGHCFNLSGHFDKAMNRRYFLVSVSHSGRQSGALEEHDTAGGTFVTTSFTCIRADTPWRADPFARPVVDGPQMGIIVGPEGEEIYCDEYGRVKVHFPWDRYSGKDDRSSCWIRVAQGWAGTMFGGMAIPRIGQHVIVDYLEGDPDQPIIMGRSYNALNLPPYKLPDNKTKMVIRSQTHKNRRGKIGFNELSFEDEKDREEVFIHAQKDMNEKIENNYSQRVNVNAVESVGHNKAIEVTNNRYEVIGGDLDISVGPNKKGMITPGGASKNVEGIGSVSYSFGTTEQGETGSGTVNLSIEKNKIETIGKLHMQTVMQNKSVDVKKNFYIDTGDELLISAGKRIVLKCGQGLLVINADGTINLNGKKLHHGFDELISLNSDIVKVN